LPRWLGGDAKEGERLLRRAAAIDASDQRIHMMLASVARGENAGE
jgi:hypothetical protein